MIKKITLFAAAVLAVGVAITGCNTGSTKTGNSAAAAAPFDTVAARKAIDTVNQQVMDGVVKGDAMAVANCYATDASFMGANGPAINGRKNIETALDGMMKSGIGKLTVNTLHVWGSESGLAEEGTYVMTAKDGKQIDKGKYIVLWKKEDGKWKIFRDCANSDLPLPGSK